MTSSAWPSPTRKTESPSNPYSGKGKDPQAFSPRHDLIRRGKGQVRNESRTHLSYFPGRELLICKALWDYVEGAKWCLFFRHLAENILSPWASVPISHSLIWAISWAQAPRGPRADSGQAVGPEPLQEWEPGCTEPPRAFVWRPCPAPSCTSWGSRRDSTASARPQSGTEPCNPLRGGRGWLACPPTTAVSFWFQEATLGPSRPLSQCPRVVLGWQPHVQHICSQDLGGLLLFSPLNFLYSSQEESREVKAKTGEGRSE